MRSRRLPFFALAALALSCAGPARHQSPVVAEAPPPAPIQLTLVATNDIHGWIYPQPFTLADGTAAEEGGLATFAGYVSILRKHNPAGTLLVDAGDLFQGTLPSNLSEGQVVVDGMNYLGYAASALGNHEFDYGPVGPSPVALRPDQDAFGALSARIRQAKFPILAANVREAASGQRPAWLGNDGTTLVERAGVKIGIVGLATPTTPSVTNPVNVASLKFGSMAEEAMAAAKALRARGAQVLIAIAHAGGKCGAWNDPNDLTSCDRDAGEIFEFVHALPKGTFDAVVAGHTHAPVAHFVDGTPVVETYGLGRFFSVVDLYVDPATRAVLADRTRITPVVPICERYDEARHTCYSKALRTQPGVKLVPATFQGEPVVPDQALAALLEPARVAAEELQRKPLGLRAPERLTRNYEGESALGLLLADALRDHEKADVALLNPGGLRDDLGPGELTYGDFYEVIPFDNTIATVTVNGDQLRRLFEAAYGGGKGVFQLSGAKVQLSRCPGPGRLKGMTLESGEAPRADRKYRVVMPDFLARGGDGLKDALAALPAGAIDLGEAREDNFRDAMVKQWMKKNTPLVPPKKGRVSFADDGSGCSAASKIDLQASQ